MASNKAITLGEFRALTKGLPADTPIVPRFLPCDIPDDSEPGVELVGIRRGGDYETGKDGKRRIVDRCVEVNVRLFYLNGDDENIINFDEDEDDE